jgi:hypothetical protein
MNDTFDYQGFIEDNFLIINKNESVVPFSFNNVQKRLYDSLASRDIVLKARQEGASSLVLALFTVDFLMNDNTRSVCIAHDKDSTIKLFDRVKFYIKSFEKKTGQDVPLQYNTRSELVNELNGSTFYVGTAGSASFGRSSTLTNIHFSEFAFYKNPEEIYLSASQAGTPKHIIIETTANGVGGFFYKQWNDAVTSRSNFTPHFFGWNDNSEYTAPKDVSISLTTEEENMKTRFNLTNGQLAWRRMKIAELGSEITFRQEYPITPEEAFISSGNPVFNVDALTFFKTKTVTEPKHIGALVGQRPPAFESNREGYLKIWEMPKDGSQYVIGADVAEGTEGGDYSCAQVINRKTYEQVAVFHGHIDVDLFGKELYKLGTFYKQAMIAPERNSIGIAVILVLREMDYGNIWIREKEVQVKDKLTPELGWVTDSKTKPIMIANLGKSIREKAIILRDELTIHELYSYQYDSAGHANAVSGSHDDRVIALLIANEMYNRVPLYSASGNDIATEDPNVYNPSQEVSNSYDDLTSNYLE